MKIKIVKQNDKRLKLISKKVIDFNKDYKSIIDEMKDVCLEKKAYACAAPQFGINERFVLIMTDEEIHSIDEGVRKYIITSYFNPVITLMIGEQFYYEACMSVDDAVGKVRRPYKISLTYQDILGDIHNKTVEGFEAIILCHEIDHLDGIEYTDRAEIMYYNIDPYQRMDLRKMYPHEITRRDGEFVYFKSKQIIKEATDYS